MGLGLACSDLDVDGGLVVGVGRKGLRLAARDRRAAARGEGGGRRADGGREGRAGERLGASARRASVRTRAPPPIASSPPVASLPSRERASRSVARAPVGRVALRGKKREKEKENKKEKKKKRKRQKRISAHRPMSGVMTPPAVSIPSESGATSRRSRSLVVPDAAPDRMPACARGRRGAVRVCFGQRAGNSFGQRAGNARARRGDVRAASAVPRMV